VSEPEITDDITIGKLEHALQISHPTNWPYFMRIIRQMDMLVHDMAKDHSPDSEGLEAFPNMMFTTKKDTITLDFIAKLVICEVEPYEMGMAESETKFWRHEKKRDIQRPSTLQYCIADCGLERRDMSPDTESCIVNLIQK
jgi:hypothetical protein